jgi:tetratricopeptide (TPR) repeat protein
MWLGDWDWDAADREFKLAIAFDPKYVTAHHWYSLYLGEMGRADEAIAEGKRALELDPASLPVLADLGRVYTFAGRYDDALKQYQKALEMGPQFGAFYNEAAYVYEQKGMTEEWFEAMGNCGAVNDLNRKAYQARDKQEFSRIGSLYGPSHDRAEFYARLGMKDEAIEQLELTYRAHDHRMSQLNVNPVWNPLRNDPRFIELVLRMKLPKARVAL